VTQASRHDFRQVQILKWDQATPGAAAYYARGVRDKFTRSNNLHEQNSKKIRRKKLHHPALTMAASAARYALMQECWN
jgi:hypothetical protein